MNQRGREKKCEKSRTFFHKIQKVSRGNERKRGEKGENVDDESGI